MVSPKRRGNLYYMKGGAMVGYCSSGVIHQQNMVIFHGEMAAQVVERNARVNIVGRVNVYSSVE